MDGLTSSWRNFHIIQICVYSNKTLYTNCTGYVNHIRTISSILHPVCIVCSPFVVSPEERYCVGLSKMASRRISRTFLHLLQTGIAADQCVAFRGTVLLFALFWRSHTLCFCSSTFFFGIRMASQPATTVIILFPVWVSSHWYGQLSSQPLVDLF